MPRKSCFTRDKNEIESVCCQDNALKHNMGKLTKNVACYYFKLSLLIGHRFLTKLDYKLQLCVCVCVCVCVFEKYVLCHSNVWD